MKANQFVKDVNQEFGFKVVKLKSNNAKSMKLINNNIIAQNISKDDTYGEGTNKEL